MWVIESFTERSGLIGGLSEFTIDPRDRFIMSGHVAGKILRKMLALGFTRKDVSKFTKRF